MTSYWYRKYIDLIHQESSKIVNWDPLHEVKVGTYGLLDIETGQLCVEGNIYDPEFQQELDKHGVDINMADFPPQEGPVENDLIITTRGAKRRDLDADKADIPGIANAPIKGKWVFERTGRRGAILVMSKPRQICIPPNVVLEPLYKVDKLVEKCLVTGIYMCSAYSMYLSETPTDRTSTTASLAFMPQAPTTSAVEVTAGATVDPTWWIDTPTGLFRHGYDQTGKYAFTPLSIMKRPIKRIRRNFIEKIRPEPEGDELWYFESTPWEPLDEDGEEDPLDPEIRAVDPFAHVEEIARLKQAALLSTPPSQ